VLFINIALNKTDLYQDSCTKKLLKLIDPETLSDMTNFIQEKQIEIPSKIE